MAVTIIEIFAPYNAYQVANGVYTVDIGISIFTILALERGDGAVNLLDYGLPSVGQGHPRLFYQTEVSDQIHEQFVLPWLDFTVPTWFRFGSSVWVQSTAEYHDADGNNVELILSYIIADATDYVRVYAQINCNNRLRWASYLDSYHVDKLDPLMMRSHLYKIDDFALYFVDADVQTAWNNSNLTLGTGDGISDQGLSTAKYARLALTANKTEIIWNDESPGSDFSKNQGETVTNMCPSGLYFTHRLNGTNNPVVKLKIVLDILEAGAGDDDGEWKEVGLLDYLARPADGIWYSQFFPWPEGVDETDVQSIRFTVDSDTVCTVDFDELRYVRWRWDHAYFDARHPIGKPWPLGAAWEHTSDFHFFFYLTLTPFNPVGMVGRWESAKEFRTEFYSDDLSNWMQMESVLLRNPNSEYTLSSWWEIWTHFASGDERWEFLQILQNRQIQLASLMIDGPTGAPFNNVWTRGEGMACFEMDGLDPDNETVQNSLQQIEQLRRASFYNLRMLAPRADSFGLSLVKLRAAGPFEWETPIYAAYQDYVDIATRFFRGL